MRRSRQGPQGSLRSLRSLLQALTCAPSNPPASPSRGRERGPDTEQAWKTRPENTTMAIGWDSHLVCWASRGIACSKCIVLEAAFEHESDSGSGSCEDDVSWPLTPRRRCYFDGPEPEFLDRDFQPFFTAPSFAQQRSQTWDACICNIASQRHRRSRGKNLIPASFGGRAPRYREGFLQVQFEDHMSRAEGLSRCSRPPLLSALLPSHPRPWFHGQDLPLMCLFDRVSCISKRPGCHAGGFSRSAHFCGRASWAVGGMKEAWGLTLLAMQICTTPLMKIVTTIMNSIGRSSNLSSHLPHNCALRWPSELFYGTPPLHRENRPQQLTQRIRKFKPLAPTNRMSPNFTPIAELGSAESRNAMHREHEGYRQSDHMDDYIRLLLTPGISVAAPSSRNLS
jgi:hypothetical protein